MMHGQRNIKLSVACWRCFIFKDIVNQDLIQHKVQYDGGTRTAWLSMMVHQATFGHLTWSTVISPFWDYIRWMSLKFRKSRWLSCTWSWSQMLVPLLLPAVALTLDPLLKFESGLLCWDIRDQLQAYKYTSISSYFRNLCIHPSRCTLFT